MKLPDAFKDKMQELLGDTEYKEFLEALNGQRQYGLRVNRLKVNKEDFLKLSPFQLEAVPWTDDGFYISGEDGPGRHPYYHAGLYYIQEPSAMLPGQILDAKPGENILDLCAAPGGKTVQIAAAMNGKGLLFSNDISAGRVKVLIKNIELYGIKNAIVLNESPEVLANHFEGFFDRVLIDAPCSGEGMFRKDESAVKSWESFKCERCTQLQEPILHSADRLLKPGGTLVYSTCTFSPEEDEQMIAQFMREHEGYELVDIPKVAGMEGGRPQWVSTGTGPVDNPAFADNLKFAARLWPHRVRGEGHFVAKLVKRRPVENTIENSTLCLFDKSGKEVTNSIFEKLPESFHTFFNENINAFPEGFYFLKGANLYHLPEAPPSLAGLKVAKHGWFLGNFDGNRFEPSHSLATALGSASFKRVVNLSADSREVNSYLKGETLMLEGKKGLTVVCVDGYTLGWAKQSGEMLKNQYPKGWRRLS